MSDDYIDELIDQQFPGVVPTQKQKGAMGVIVAQVQDLTIEQTSGPRDYYWIVRPCQNWTAGAPRQYNGFGPYHRRDLLVLFAQVLRAFAEG